MDTHDYPGRGLSLSQLVFALGEELKRVAYSPLYVAKGHFELTGVRHAGYLCSFTFDTVSQLDRDASTALTSIREWRNSFAQINRIPTDILSLIPTHLSSDKDRFRAASVCRRWRGALLNHGALWSRLFLPNGEAYVSLLLERTKGSPLDIIVHRDSPVGTTTMISSHAQKIRSLEFRHSDWQHIATFSEFNSGQLPLLRTLKIISPTTSTSHGQHNVVTPPSLPFFRGSINLENFVFHSRKLPSLSHFVFPNLTTFNLVSLPGEEEYSVLSLLDFLKASPMLQTVEVKVCTEVGLWGIPEETVVTLPKVETFSLHLVDDPGTLVYDIAAHISCPRARHTFLMYERDNTSTYVGLEIFPTFSWNRIVHQYAASPIEEVTLEIKGSGYDPIEGFLTFRSSDATVIKLGLNIHETGVNEDELSMPPEHMGWAIFYQALTTIHDHPLRSHLKRLHIKYRTAIPDTWDIVGMGNKVEQVFSSLEPLDDLTIHGCDLRVFLSTFLKVLQAGALEPPVVFRRVKELTILHPLIEDNERECMDAIVELARLQHTLGIPFERMTVRMWNLPIGMEEELRQWVGVVDCRKERDREEYV